MDVEQTYNKAKFRGKLYALSHESAWEDTGTGFVSILGADENRRLVFTEEEGGKVLHDRPVFASDTYQLPGEGDRQTMIVWEDPETDRDWALSFQDPDGTNEIWEAISGADACTFDDRTRVLPLPKLGALAECSRLLQCVPPSQREMLAVECLSAKFLASLRESFLTVEDLGNVEALSHIWQIVKGVFLLSNQKLTERYLAADAFEDVLGMLEYDDGLPPSKRIAHRQVMKVKVRFSQVLSFEDAAMLERVHLNYRLQYLKDIVLPRLLDDGAFASLNQMIHVNISIILDYLQRSTPLMDRLFAQIREKDLQSLLFLQDMCRLSRQIVPSERAALHERMFERGVFEVLTPFVAGGPFPGESETLRPNHCAAEVLLLFSTNDPAPLRRFLTSEASVNGRVLLSAVVRLMLSEEDQGVQGQICEMLKQVMDPSSLEERERDKSFDAFYERGGMDEICAPLGFEANCSAMSPSVLFGLQLVCELLAFAVSSHGYRSKIYVVRNGVAQRAARLLQAPQRFLQLAPIRLIKAMVISKDDAYHRYLTKNGVFAQLLQNFQLSCRPPALGGNLVVSATLELIEFIRIENVKLLVDHICRKHGAVVREYAPRFKTLEGLLLKHQQNLEYEAFPPEHHVAGGPLSAGGGSSTASGRPGREDSDDDEEAYFEDDDDEDQDEVSAAGGAPQDASAAAPPDAAPGASSPSDMPNGTDACPALRGLIGAYEDAHDADGNCGNSPAEAADDPGDDNDVVADANVDASVAEDSSSLDAATGEEVPDENCKGVLSDADSAGGVKDVQSLGHVPKRPRTSETS